MQQQAQMSRYISLNLEYCVLVIKAFAIRQSKVNQTNTVRPV
jgi:hypothetical protein